MRCVCLEVAAERDLLMEQGLLLAIGAHQARQAVDADAPVLELGDEVACALALAGVGAGPDDELALGRQAHAAGECVEDLVAVDLAAYLPAGDVRDGRVGAGVLDHDVLAVWRRVADAHRSLLLLLVLHLAAERVARHRRLIVLDLRRDLHMMMMLLLRNERWCRKRRWRWRWWRRQRRRRRRLDRRLGIRRVEAVELRVQKTLVHLHLVLEVGSVRVQVVVVLDEVVEVVVELGGLLALRLELLVQVDTLELDAVLDRLELLAHERILLLEVVQLVVIGLERVAQRLDVLQLHLHLELVQRVLLVHLGRQLLGLELHPLLELARLLHVQLLVVLAYVADDLLELLFVELHLVAEGQRVRQLAHLEQLLLVDLLDELDVLAQRLIVVLDRDASVELVVELVEQLDELRPRVVAIRAILLDLGELVVDRLLHQLVLLLGLRQLDLEVLDARLVGVAQLEVVAEASLELVVLVLAALGAHVGYGLQVGHVVYFGAHVEQIRLVVLAYLTRLVAPVRLRVADIAHQLDVLVLQALHLVHVARELLVELGQLVLLHVRVVHERVQLLLDVHVDGAAAAAHDAPVLARLRLG